MRKTRLIALLIIGIFFFSITTIAEEITLTTYYPAPYGEYQQLYVSGNVGIGTAGPGHGLEVTGGGVGAQFLVRNGALTANSNVLLSGGDAGLGGIGTGFLGIRIDGSTSGIGGGPFHTRLRFETDRATVVNSSSGNLVTFLNAGNVGIGTTAPGAKLDIALTGDGAELLRLSTERSWSFFQRSTGASTALDLRSNAGSKYFSITNFDGEEVARFNAGAAASATNYISFAEDRVRITDAGNVGIGTTTPGEILTVQKANAPTFLGLSGASGSHTSIAIGRTAAEARLGIAGVAGQYAGGAVAGDAILRVDSSTQKLHFLAGAGSAVMTITTGNVGIGTTNPTARLDVAGDVKLTITSGGGNALKYIPGLRELHWDIAEDISATADVEAGDVVVIDSTTNEQIAKSTKPYDTLVAGIISTTPAFHIAMPDGKTPLALAGRVLCKVTTQDGGSIRRGDLLVTSSKPGYAMRAEPDKLCIGTVLGKALEPLDKGDGKIMVLVTLQ